MLAVCQGVFRPYCTPSCVSQPFVRPAGRTSQSRRCCEIHQTATPSTALLWLQFASSRAGGALGWQPVEAGCFRAALRPEIDPASGKETSRREGNSEKSREEEVMPVTGTDLTESLCTAKPCSGPPKLRPPKSLPSFKSQGREPWGSTPQNGHAHS